MAIILALVAAVLAPGSVGAQAPAAEWPSRPVRLIVPFPAGGSTDILARLVARAIEAGIGQNVVVENKGGAGGMIGSAEVARSAPDGYTLQVSSLGTHGTAPLIYANVPFDANASFTHVAGFGGLAMALVVHPRLGVATLGDFVRLAKAKPGSIDYGTPGNGTSNQLMTELFKATAGVDLQHVPYRGSGPAVNALVAGEVPSMFALLSSAGEPVKAGQLLALGIASRERTPAFPAIPTFRELGYPDLVASTWFGVSGPAGLPAPIVAKLERAVEAMVVDPEVRRRLIDLGMEVEYQSSKGYSELVASELKRWGPVIRQAGIKAE